MLTRVHAGQAAVFKAIDFANNLLHQLVFENNVAESLMVNCLEYGVLVRALELEYLQKT